MRHQLGEAGINCRYGSGMGRSREFIAGGGRVARDGAELLPAGLSPPLGGSLG